MNYLSLFSGIEAATVAWHPLGWTPVAFSEIDKTASKFLAETYSHVPNLGDVTKITEEMIKSLGHIDVIIFGSPCTDLSIAGKRLGLEGERSGLFRDAIRIIQWARKHCGLRFALWENVPGAYSSNKGRDFTEVVASLAGLENFETPANGWGKEGAAVGNNGLLEWACLDAQWFGLAARRKRIFALLDFGDWESRPPILLEPEGLRGDSPPSRKAREGYTGSVESRSIGVRRISHGGYLVDNQGSTLSASSSSMDQSDLVIEGVTAHHPEIFQQNASGEAGCGDVCGTLATNANASGRNTPLLFCGGTVDSSLGGSPPNEVIGTLSSDSHSGGGKPLPAVAYCIQARRLTPLECERLMGFPDHYTASMSNSRRYRTIGNSMAVPVIRYIGEKIMGALSGKNNN